MILNDVPDDINPDSVISVTQQICEVIHPAPINARRALFDFVGNVSGSFTDDFKIAFGCHPTHLVGVKLLKNDAFQQCVDLGDGLQNIPQPIFYARRHLENFDQIIGDPLRHTRFEHVTHRYLG